MIRCYTKTGSRHADRREENQDAVRSGEKGQLLALALADGVSSCRAAGPGARTACRAAVDALLDKGERLFTLSGKQAAAIVLSEILAALSAQAGGDGAALEEYSSTLACALVDRESGRTFYCSVGDSLILAAGGKGCQVVAMPDSRWNGCCATTTRGAAGQAQAGSFDAGAYHSIVLCSDGAWRLMYDKNRLNPAVRRLLLEGDYRGLSRYLEGCPTPDDCTLLSFEKESGQRKLPYAVLGSPA